MRRFYWKFVEGGAPVALFNDRFNPDVIFRVIGDKAEINRNALKDKTTSHRAHPRRLLPCES